MSGVARLSCVSETLEAVFVILDILGTFRILDIPRIVDTTGALDTLGIVDTIGALELLNEVNVESLTNSSADGIGASFL